MHVWEYITFLANTLIFFIVGVVIVKEIKDMEADKAGCKLLVLRANDVSDGIYFWTVSI